MPATGRPGRAVTTRGDAAAAHAPLPPAGYNADELDPSLTKYLAVCEKAIRQAETLGKRVELVLAGMQEVAGDQTIDDANAITTLFERMTKAGLNLVKATDELSRLRSFLAGGPDSRPDLQIRGEIELRSLLIVAVKQLGWRVTDGAGKPIEVEAAQ